MSCSHRVPSDAEIRAALAQGLLLAGRRWRARLNERLKVIGQTDARCAALAEIAGAEHGVVHELLERQMAALETLAAEPTPERFTEATEIFEALESVLLSHLGYEEDQIGDALGYYGLI